MKTKNLFFFGLFCFLVWQVTAQTNITYQTPPKEIADLVNAKPSPRVSMHPQSNFMLIMERASYPSIEELAQPELRLAGLRINPNTNGESRSGGVIGLQLKNIEKGNQLSIKGLPDNPKLNNFAWSVDGKYAAFTHTDKEGISLWVLDVQKGEAQKLTANNLNPVLTSPFAWLSDSKTLIFMTIPEGRNTAPKEPIAPAGPIVQENLGKQAQARTFQDLLKNPYDEQLFEYYGKAQINSIAIGNASRKIGKPALYTNIEPSPDGKYLMVMQIQQPFSYLVPYNRFPTLVEIWDLQGNIIKQVAKLPLAEDIPRGFDAVRAGERNFNWRADKPASLFWVEALDDGNPAKKVEFRDQLFYIEAPFTTEKKASHKFKLRFARMVWGNDKLAIATEIWRTTRTIVGYTCQPNVENSLQKIYERSTEDRYKDMGSFATIDNQYGRNILLTQKNNQMAYLIGQGASPEGDQPFIDEYDFSTQKTKRIWQSQAPYFERPVMTHNLPKGQIITLREAKTENPNYFLHNLKSNQLINLTKFPHPYPQLQAIEKQNIRYKRKDGVDLQAELYLPKGFKKGDKPLPLLLWAYPYEFKSASNASQVQGSPYEFVNITWGSPLYFATQGYAILNNASMPIIGEGTQEPNDTFISQLVANAEAAINTVADMGIADKNRVAVGGHSYGAFMTANLLAHSDLFAAGIARSGAYNRTLTPFGFQGEERSLWETPKVYLEMSPFMYADKIKEPILLIHGEADNNSGTFPIQSERFYNALKGHSATTRFVLLPHESHGYAAKESILHMLWEINTFLDKYVKNKNTEAK